MAPLPLINEAPPQEAPLPLIQDDSQPLPPDVAASRAETAVFGVNSKIDGPSYHDYVKSFTDGDEASVRKFVAAKIDEKNFIDRQQRILDAVKSRDTPLSKEEVGQIFQAAQNPTNPVSVLETEWAKRYMDHLNWPLQKDEPSFLKDVFTQMPVEYKDGIDKATNYSANLKWLQTYYEDSRVKAEQQGWPSYLFDLAKMSTTIQPVYQRYFNLPSVYMIAQPHDEFVKNVQAIGETKNPSDRVAFAKYLLGESQSEKIWNNVLPLAIPGVEVSAAAGIAKAGIRSWFRKGIIDMVKKSAVDHDPEILAPIAAGDLDKAVSVGATKAMQRILDRRADPIREANAYGLSLFNKSSTDLLENPGNYGKAATQAIVDNLTDSRTTFNKLLDMLPRNELNPALREKLPEMVEAAKAEIKAQVRTINDHVLDVNIPEPQIKTGSWFAEIQLGKSPTEFFRDKGNATKQAIAWGLDGYEVKQTGAGWYVSKPIPININSPGMQQYFVHLPENKSSFSTWNAFFSRWSSPNETFSQWANRNRLVTTHAPSIILDYMNQQLQPVKQLAKRTFPFTERRKRLQEFERVVDNARAMDNPDIPGAKGYTFKNPGELEYHYRKWIGRSPDDEEVGAYFAWKKVTEMDHALRVVSLVKGKQANGVMSHTFHVMENGEKISSPEFEATPITTFPNGSHHVVLVVGDKPGEDYLSQINLLGSKNHKELSDAVNSGQMKMAQVWAPDQNPFKGWGNLKAGDQPTFVISKNMSTKPLDWQAQLPSKGGGHFVYDASHWLVQPKLSYSLVGKKKDKLVIYFQGSTKYMPFNVEREGQNVGAIVNEAFGHMQKADVDSARKVIEDNLKGVDFKDDFHKNFLNPSKRDPLTGRMLKAPEPRFNLDLPFQLLRNNKQLEFNPILRELEKKYPNATIVDSTRSGNKSKQFQVEFTQERDASNLFTIANEGSAGQPIYNKQKAPMLDAIPIMNKSMTKLASSFLMNDYKVFQFSHWLQEHRDLLKDVTDNELANSPLYWFHHAEYSDKTSALAKQAEIQRMQIRQFLGQYSDQDNFLEGVTQKLINSLYDRVSPNAAKAVNPTWLLHTMKDPAAFFRSMTFHLKFGWSIPQILVQSNTYVNILGIAGPVKASQGTFATLLHQWSRINANPAIIDAMDKKATFFGWRPGEWKEAHEILVNSGFMTRGRQHAMRDDFMSQKVISTGGQKFLDWGSWFFNEGDRATAMGAWYTAFKEYRDLHPTGALNNADKLKIMERADILNNNMSRASNALYQKGWKSLPTQFLTYSIRQAELMWGHRLTTLEKARLLGTQAIIYGIPTGLSVTGLPSQTFIRQNAIQNGYIPENDNYFQELLNDGAISTALNLVGGTKYNVSSRYGGGGISRLDDVFNPDKTWWDIVGGATGSTMEGIWDASDPFRAAMLSIVNGDDRAFKVTGDHILRLGEEATAIQGAHRAYEAFTTGNWMSKNRAKLAQDATTSQALVSFVSGLLPDPVNDRIMYSNISQQQENATKDAIKRYNLEVHRAMQAYRNNDDTNGEVFWTNAASIMDKYIPADEKMKVMREALNDWWPLVPEIRHKFFTKGIPPAIRDTRTQQYYQYQQGQQK
jgi:hypothetical protein